MASTFSVQTSAYQTRYLKLTCTQKSNGSSANSSTITWKLEVLGGNTDFYTTGATKVIINGTTVYSKARTNWDAKVFPVARGSVSGTLTISHDNEGNLTIPVELTTAIYTTTTRKASGNWTLDSIPRYATSVQSLKSKTETSITMGWTSDSTIDYIWYSKDGGTNWTGLDVTDGTSGTYTISGLSANTTYSIKTRVRRKDSQLTTDSSATSVTTYDYPYCTSSPNFVVGEKLTLSFYNPLSRSITIHLVLADGTEAGGDLISTTSITGYTGSTFVNKLYNSIPNATSGKYKVKVTYGSVIRTRDTSNTYTVNLDNCRPTFTNFTYKDSNTNITNITGNDQVLVNGKSTLQVTVSPANKMVANNGANPSKYIATIDSNTANANYSSSSDVVLNLGTVKASGSKRLTVTAYDTRNNTKQAYKDITVYNYTKPVINVDITRLNNFEETTTIKVNGSYEKLNIGGVNKNSITAVEYRYQETGEAWSDWATINTTLSDGKFTCNDVTLSLDNSKSFNIEVRATDKLDSNKASGSVDVGVALFFISTTDKACYINDKKVATIEDNGVSVSLNEPTDKSALWVKKSRNLFNKNNYNLVHFLFTNNVYTTTSLAQTIYIKVEPNTTYTITKNYWYDGSLSLATSSNVPVSGGAINQTKGTTVTSDTNNYITITTGANDNYLAIYLNWGSTGITETLNKLQIEQGSVSTEYEEYVEPSIYVNRGNGSELVYDSQKYQKYNEDEIIVGTWFGQTLYRRLVNTGTLTNTSEKKIAHNIANIKYIVSIRGFAYTSAGGTVNLPHVHTNGIYNIYVSADRTNITIGTGTDRTGWNSFVILEYIKTD